MIVCQCGVVSDRAIGEAVSRGARSVAAVCRETGAGRDCGACVFGVKAQLCEHLIRELESMEVDGAAS